MKSNITTILILLTTVLTAVYASGNTDLKNTNANWKPTIEEAKKEKIQPFIAYFMESQKAEMEGDEDFSQGFPWRSFQASIKALETPEAASWIIETIPSWVDGRDQESLALLCQKTAELASPKDLEKLIMILKDNNTPEDGRSWGLVILEKTSKEENLNYLQENIEGILASKVPKNNLDIGKAIGKALKGKSKPENIEILNSVLKGLEEGNAQGEKENNS
jgi:hypothetical protein